MGKIVSLAFVTAGVILVIFSFFIGKKEPYITYTVTVEFTDANGVKHHPYHDLTLVDERYGIYQYGQSRIQFNCPYIAKQDRK